MAILTSSWMLPTRGKPAVIKSMMLYGELRVRKKNKKGQRLEQKTLTLTLHVQYLRDIGPVVRQELLELKMEEEQAHGNDCG